MNEWVSALVKSALVVAALVLSALIGAERHLLSASLIFLVFASTLINEYWLGIRPIRRLAETAPIILEDYSEPFMDFLRGKGLKPRINVLLLSWGWRWLGVRRRYLKVEWSVGMENHPDVNIRFPLVYGVAGECFRTKRPVYVDLVKASDKFRLPLHLNHRTEHLTAIFSYPIYEPKKKGHQSGRLLGVLNLDSEARHAYTAFRTGRMFSVIDERMKKLAVIAGLFYR